MKMPSLMLMSVLLVGLAVKPISAEDNLFNFKSGEIQLKSAGPLVFGPSGVLFMADPRAATIYALQAEKGTGQPEAARYDVDNLDQKISSAVGGQATIRDIKANPETGNLFAVATVRGRTPALVKIEPDGRISEVSLSQVSHSQVVLPDAPEDKEVELSNRRKANLRPSSITDLAWAHGELIVAGATSASAPAAVRTIAFPFQEGGRGTSIEIYHAAHGRSEDYALAQTVVPLVINGEPNILAGFVCTPLVKFPLEGIKQNEKVTGTTVAELGNRNRPLDMIVYEKGGKTWLLSANSARGVMKISTEQIDQSQLSEPVRGGGTAGLTYETLSDLQNVTQLAKLNDTHAVILVQPEEGVQHLKTIPLP